MARRRFGLCDTDEADVVYIRAQVGAARGETRYRQERYHAPTLLGADPGGRDSCAGAGGIGAARQAYEFEEDEMKKLLMISMSIIGLALWVPVQSHAQTSSVPAKQATRDIKVISSAGARALVDACSAWAQQNKQTVAIAILDWGGNLVESHAMEGAAMNAIDTALAESQVGVALAARYIGDQQDGAQRRESGADVHARLPTTRRASHHGRWPGGRSDGRLRRRRREMRSGGDRRGVQGPADVFYFSIGHQRHGLATDCRDALALPLRAAEIAG